MNTNVNQKIFNGRFNYRGFGNCSSYCDLKIDRTPTHDVVLCTELNGNPGTSVTNMAEDLATLVMKDYQLDHNKLIWVERYEADDYLNEEDTYDLTTFTWSDNTRRFSSPKWKRITKEEYEKFISE